MREFMRTTCRTHTYATFKYGVLFPLLCVLTLSLTGCFNNLQEIFGTPTPSPTPDPDIEIDPEIDLDPVGGYAGTLVRVTGEGWMPGKLVIFKLEDAAGRSGILTANIPDSTGNFQASFNYPANERWLTPGIQTIVAYTLNEDLEDTGQFVVIEPTAVDTPTDDPPTQTPTPTNTPLPTPTFTPTPAATQTQTATPFEFLLLPTATDDPTIQTPTATSTVSTTITATAAATETLPPATPPATLTKIATATVDSQQTSTPTETPSDDAVENAPVTPSVISPEQITTPSSADGAPTAVVITDADITTPSSAVPASTNSSTGVPVAIASATDTVPLIDLSGTPTSLPAPTATLLQPTVTPTWTPLPTVVVIEEWRADYWNNLNLSGPATLIRNETEIDFDWGLGSPDNSLPVEGFSARWSRSLFFQPGIYTFSLEVDDGARLTVDGQRLIDSWEDGGRRTLTAQTVLSEGQHQVVLEYYENQGNAVARLGWENRATFSGWRGEYFANTNLSGRPALLRDDPEIDFGWGVDSPTPTLPEDGFSVRWLRSLSFDAGIYRFRATADDGVRVWIDDELIIDEWRDQSEQTFTTELSITEGEHDLRVEYYEQSLGAIMRFSWEEVTTPTLVPTPTWTPAGVQPTPTWTPAP